MTEKETRSIERKIRRTERDIANNLGHFNDAQKKWITLTNLVRSAENLRHRSNAWRKTAYHAKRIEEITIIQDDLYRQRDGRPTRKEEAIADSNRMEENMMREAHRERTEWAQDEAGARYDSVNEQDRDCGPTYDPDQDG